MRDYGVVSPKFWIGGTGKALRGNVEAQLVALYLMTSPHANMIGVFYCPLATIAKETGLDSEGALKGLQSLIEADFVHFDHDTEEVFALRMAAYQVGEHLEPKDNRCKGVARELERVMSDRLRSDFHAIYSGAFHLHGASEKAAVSRTPSQAPPKPHRSQKQDQEQKQEQKGEPARERATPPRSRKTPLPENFAVSDRVKAWAKEKGFGRLDEHLDAFLRKVKANGYTYIDWDAAFMEAIREDWAKLRGRAPNGAAPPSDGAEGEWHETRAGVEKRAAEMEMPKWDELVPYPTYKARVMSEHERRAH